MWVRYTVFAAVCAGLCVPRAVRLFHWQTLLRFYETETARLSAENARLQQEISRMKTDPEAVERSARETFGLLAPGEVEFVLKETNVPR